MTGGHELLCLELFFSFSLPSQVQTVTPFPKVGLVLPPPVSLMCVSSTPNSVTLALLFIRIHVTTDLDEHGLIVSGSCDSVAHVDPDVPWSMATQD